MKSPSFEDLFPGMYIGSSFRFLHDTYRMQERHFSEERTRARGEIDALKRENTQNSPEMNMSIFMHEAEWHQLYGDKYPAFLRSSTIIQAALLLEYYLRKLCDVLEKRFSTPISHRDLKGSVVDQSKTFLARFIDCLAKDDPRWQPVHDLVTIRNTLVHKNGYVEADERKNIEMITCRTEGICVGNDARLEMQEICILYFIGTCESFLRELCEITKLNPSKDDLIASLMKRG